MPLANALLSSTGGITVTSSVITAGTADTTRDKYSHGYYSVAPGNNLGLKQNGIVLSTGNVLDYSSRPNSARDTSTDFGRTASAAHNALLSPITGRSSHKDVAALEMVFNAGPTTKEIAFDLVFGSEEYPEYTNDIFVDGLGLFVNGTNIAFSYGKPINIKHPGMAAAVGTELDGILQPWGYPLITVSAPVTPGSVGNTLKLLIADASDAIFDSTVYLSSLRATGNLSFNTLRNFDIVSPPDMQVNDFQITLKGINRPFATGTPETPDYVGGQINHVYPFPSRYHQLPSGWTPESVTTDGTDTVIKWGPGASISGQKLHFGVSLTQEGEAACYGICMAWTQNGVPVYAGANPNAPLTVMTPHPQPGEASVQLVNQTCPEQTTAPPRWLGPLHVAVLPAHAELSDLLPDNPLMATAPAITEGMTYLAADEILTLPNVDANSPIATGTSLVVWYDVFADAAGNPGQFMGTSFTAFNIVEAVPEPHTALLSASTAILLALCWRSLRSPSDSF
jgi:hypothetical protein